MMHPRSRICTPRRGARPTGWSAQRQPSMAEQERGLRPSQTKFGGRYQQAWQRFFDTLKEAKARGVAAGIIADEETLDDLEERLGGQPSHYLDVFLRAS